VIDLHLHTTESDGRLSPRALVELAAASGVHVMAVTDHDTTSAFGEVRRHADELGLEAVSGIEITAIEGGDDVHVLGYFVDPGSEALQSFLTRQRRTRIERVRAIAERLAALGLPVDVAPLVAHAEANEGRSIGRPQVATALIESGHVADTREAFDRWLGRGRPAFVPRAGARAAEVIDVIHLAGGLASMAHPGLSIADAPLSALRDRGLDALEAFHPEHDAAAVQRYVELADALGMLLTGGSDFHGDPVHGRAPGAVSLPAEHWNRLRDARQLHAGK
jgi:hypothetical protein